MTKNLEITLIDKQNNFYPKTLAQIPDAPEKLYVWGNPEVLNNLAVAIVGSRKPTDYGLRVAGYLARNLSRRLSVVSGLAYGIDTVALKESVAAGGRPVIAVIGSGLDQNCFYPQANWNLAKEIVLRGGVVISEYPVGTKPMKHHFPARNRIIAGLSQGVIVVEAGQKSGALITADLALDYNREVFGVSGSVFIDQAKGVNQLIKSGAHLVTDYTDVLDVLNITKDTRNETQPISKNTGGGLEDNILEYLNENPLSIDDLSRKLQLDSRKVSSTLTLMEIKGMVKSTSTGKFIKL